MAILPPPLPAPLLVLLILLASLLGYQVGDAAVATASASQDGSTCSSSSTVSSRPTCVAVEYLGDAASQYEKEVLGLLQEACHTADGTQRWELPSSHDLLVVSGAQRAKESDCGLFIVVSLEYSARSFPPLAKKEEEYRRQGVRGPVVFLRFLTPDLPPVTLADLGLTSPTSVLVQPQLQHLQLLRHTPHHLSAVSALRCALSESQVFAPQEAPSSSSSSSSGKTKEDGPPPYGSGWRRALWVAVPFGYAAGVLTGPQVKQGLRQVGSHARRMWGVEPQPLGFGRGGGSGGPMGPLCCCGGGCGPLAVPAGEVKGGGRRGG